MHLESVQTFLARRLTGYLSGQLNTEVTVRRVSIRFVKSVVLEGLFIRDLHGDTLLYADELTASVDDISTADHKLDIGRITLSNGRFNLHHYKGDEHDNLHFITEYFSSTDTTSSSSPWKVKVSDLSLKNLRFSHNEDSDTASYTGVNFSHLDVSNISGDFRNINTINDSIFVDIQKLTFKERSGFYVKEFSAGAKVSSTEIRLKKLIIETKNTGIHTDLTFRFDNFLSFDEFTSQVNWSSDFVNSKVSFSDIAYFAHDLNGIDSSLTLDGLFQGSVRNFKGRNVSIRWGQQSYFKGNISMKGLPVIEDTYIDVAAEEIETNKSDIETIPVPPFDENHFIIIPENLAALGNVSFKGKFTGFVSDFVAYGKVTTAIGSVNSDINVKYNKELNRSYYSGHLAATDFDAGLIADISDLGKVTFSMNVKGSGMRLDNISAKLDGKVDKFEFRKYTYHNIVVDGQVAKKLFNGSLNVTEPNVDFDFRGSIDYRGKLPEFHFAADIRRANLDTLNIFHGAGESVLRTSVTTYFTGSKLDNFVGGIDIENTDLITGTKLFHVNSINIRADKTTSFRTIDINSDNLDAHFKGQFELAKLGDAFKEILPRYLPSVILPQKSISGYQDFTYDIRLKNLNVITEMFLPSWDFAPNTTLTGNFNSVTGSVEADISTSWIRFRTFTFDDLDLHVKGSNRELNLDVVAQKIRHNGRDFIMFPSLAAKTESNKINYILRLADVDTLSNRAHLEGSMGFTSANIFNLKVDSSYIVVENKVWDLDKMNLVEFDSSNITLNSFRFSRDNESIQLDGTIGKRATDRLEVRLAGFNLSHLSALLNTGKTNFGGVISGDVVLTDAYHQFQLESDLKIANLMIDEDSLGNASIISRYNSDQNVVVGNISIVKGIAKIVDISGNYYLNRENNNLDFNVRLSNVYVHPLEKYIDDIMTEVYGKVSAELKLTGTPARPVFNGTVTLNKMSLIVDYLKTRYSFNTVVNVKENVFELDELKLYDVNNNEGVASGKVYHDYFKNFRFDVELQAKKFQVLNTSGKDNSLYYGTANATGYAHFYGPLQNMNMDISLSPDRGTTLNIPLNTASDLNTSSYITFIDRTKDTSNTITRSRIDLSGVKLNMNLDMNRNANINIIFDEKIGDVISGSGSGSLRLDINTAGNFGMYGTYTIDEGEYLFTLQNLINKKFKIDEGSRITWGGDPYEALVDLSAVYVVYTSTLYNVLLDSTYKRRVPVDCRLFLKNKLMNPTISYEITVRGLDPTEESLLKTTLNSEQEINKQMLGLLFFNQFFPVNGAGQKIARFDAGSGAGASASELLSNQVSNWLGQLSKDVNIGFNYRARDTYTNEEIQLLFTKAFFDERLILNGNVGYLGDQSYVNSNVVGDFYAEYKVSPDGRFRLKGFNRSNADNIISYSQAPYSQGIGFFYRQEFNTFKDLLIRFRLKKKADEVVKP